MRKHHNKLYYGLYRHKTIFKLPGSLQFYPTTDQALQDKIEKCYKMPSVVRLAKFIITNRNDIKFRFQDKYSIFYTNKNLAQDLIENFWDYWYGSENVDPKFSKLNKNVVGCTRLPHGKYQYQIHFRKDIHRKISNKERKTLFDFLERNVDDYLITNRYVHDWLEGKQPFCYHGYIYAKEEKMLTPLYMIIQKGIDKVIKFKKVKNGSNKKITTR